MRKTFALIGSSFFILLLFGCGPETENVEEVVNSYHQAIIDQDVETVMALSVSEEQRNEVQAMIGFRSEGMKRAGGLPEIVDVEITGNTAVVRCKFGPTEQNVNLRKIDGEWKIDTP